MSRDKPDNADRDILKGDMNEFCRLYLADKEFYETEKVKVASEAVSQIVLGVTS